MPIKLSNQQKNLLRYLDPDDFLDYRKNKDKTLKKRGYIKYALYRFYRDTVESLNKNGLSAKIEKNLIKLFQSEYIENDTIRRGSVILAGRLRAQDTLKYIFTLNLNEQNKDIREEMKETLKILEENKLK